MKQKTPEDIWAHLDGCRSVFLKRIERYAQLTEPTLHTPEGWQKHNYELNLDYQSFGAQLLNHLTNKLMLALFAPSRPFFRLDPDDSLIVELAAGGVKEDDVQAALSVGEKKAVQQMDRLAIRPRLYSMLKLLIATGNALTIFDKNDKRIRILGLKYWVVKRNAAGKVHTLVMREKLQFDELDEEVQKFMRAQPGNRKYEDDTEVCHYHHIYRKGKRYFVDQWVDKTKLPNPFSGGQYSELECPYQVSTWELEDESDYGTGYVEKYSGALEALSSLSKARLFAGILASEFRWLANPAGMTSPTDFKDSENGQCLPGLKDDLVLVNAAGEVAQAMAAQSEIIRDYVNQLGRAFLMGSAVTRDAERVTAEEIRLTATELETSLGGAYSRIAVDVQQPLALFLLALANIRISGRRITPVIVTGLDALSRNGDLEALKMYLADAIEVLQVPPETQDRLEMQSILAALAAGHGVPQEKYVATEAVYQQRLAQRQAAAIQAQQAIDSNNAAATAGASAAADAAAQQGPTQ